MKTKMIGENMKHQRADNRENNWSDKVVMTRHYIERYHERILDKYLPQRFNESKVKRRVYKDMDNKLMEREKNFIELFSSSGSIIKLPFESNKLIVIQNRRLITILN